MIIFAFIMAFLFSALAGGHLSLILERKRTGHDIPIKEYVWTIIDACIALYWLTVLAGTGK